MVLVDGIEVRLLLSRSSPAKINASEFGSNPSSKSSVILPLAPSVDEFFREIIELNWDICLKLILHGRNLLVERSSMSDAHPQSGFLLFLNSSKNPSTVLVCLDRSPLVHFSLFPALTY